MAKKKTGRQQGRQQRTPPPPRVTKPQQPSTTQSTKQSTKKTTTPIIDPAAGKEASKFYKDAVLQQTELRDIAEQYKDTWQDISEAVKSTINASSELGDSFQEVEDVAKKIVRNIENVGEEYYEQINLSDKINSLQEQRAKQLEKQSEIAAELNGLSKENNTARKDELNIEKAILADAIATNNAVLKQLEGYEAIAKTLDTANDKAHELGISIRTITEEIEGVFKSSMSMIENLPGGGVLGKFLGVDKKLEIVNQKIQESFIKNLAKTGSTGAASFAALSAGVKTFMTSLLPIAGTIAAIGAAFFIVKKALDVDSETATMAKNLGISKEEAHEAHHTSIELAQELHMAGVNAKEVGKAMEDLTASTGLNVAVLSKANDQLQSMVTSQAMMTQYSSVTAEEFGSLTNAAALLNVDVSALASATMAFGDELVSGDELLKDISKVSKTVLINFSKNPKELIKAVKQAKMLGLSLDQVAAAGDALLNIESSLEAEMAANVLTGRKINMNKARQLSLDGDIAGLQEELAKQAGSAADYEKMRPYQRKAFAAALGMELTQVDEMMAKQKVLEQLGINQTQLEEKLKKTGKEREAEIARTLKLKGKDAAEALKAAYADEDRVSTQTKLADIGQKIADAAAKLGTALLPIIEGFGKIADHAGLIQGIVFGIGGFMAGKMLVGTINLVKQFMAAIAAKKLEKQVDEESLRIEREKLLVQEGQTVATGAETTEKMIQAPLDTSSAGAAVTEAGAVGTQVIEEAVLTGEKTIQAGADVTSATAKQQGLRATLSSIGPQIRATIAAGTEAAAKVTSAIARSFGAGALTIIPAILGAIAAIGGYIYMNDGVVGPANGYSRVMTGPEGSIAFNDKDTIVAGTNLNQSSNSETTSSANTKESSSSSNSEVVALLKELIQKIDQPVKISIGNRVIDEMETMMSVRKSYVTKIDKGYGAFG